jgi:hypothetical protein
MNIATEPALSRADGNQGVAAVLLGLSREALNKRRRRRSPARGPRGVCHRLPLQCSLRGTMALILKASRGFRPSLVVFCPRGEARPYRPLLFLTS